MRVALVTCVVAAAVGSGAGAAASVAEPAATDLKITVWPQGRDKGESDTYTLTCSPARGSMPRAAGACTELLKLSRPFRPVPPDTFCTDQYGGPQQALVTGKFKGAGVWARFSATNGCQIARAKRVSFLLPGFGTAVGA